MSRIEELQAMNRLKDTHLVKVCTALREEHARLTQLAKNQHADICAVRSENRRLFIENMLLHQTIDEMCPEETASIENMKP